MKTLNLVQGSPEWLAHRANPSIRNASDAPAAMGASKYTTRTELLHRISTGHVEDVSPHLQALFDRGHAAEAAIRPHVEKLVGDDLYPATGLSDEYPNLSASFDGITMDETVIFEHKLWNEELAKAVMNGDDLDMTYVWQLEHQLIVSGAEKAIFVVSDGTPEKMAHLWYYPVPGRREALLAGWAQFDKDLAAYTPEAPAAHIVATAIMDLPAVNVQIEGALQVLSNLPAWGDQLREFIGGLNQTPESDQDFADAENEIKVLKRAEDELEAAESRALSQIAVVDEMRKLKAMLHKLARDTRLAREKLVKDRKELVRREIQQRATAAIQAHIAEHNAGFGRALMPPIAYDVANAMKGKKTMKSLKDAAHVEVARAKIEADRIACIIGANLATLNEKAASHRFLFSDTASLVLKDPEAVSAIVDQRIQAHEAEQRAKAEAAAEAEREKIRREEQAKAEREARERIAAEQAEVARIAAEARKAADDAEKAEREKAAALDRKIERAAEEFGGLEQTRAAVEEDAPADALQIAKATVTPKYTMPPTAQIVDAIAQRFVVPRHVAAAWLRTINQAELSEIAA